MNIHPHDIHLVRAQASGSWFLFRRDFVLAKIMTKMEALFFQDLINRAGMRKTKRSKDGFFLCTADFLRNSLDWDDKIQKRLLRALKGKGYLITEGRGLPRKRWVKLFPEQVEKALDKALDTSLDDPCKKGSLDPQEDVSRDPPKKNKKKTTSSSCSNGVKKHGRPAGDSVRLSEVFAAEQSLDEKLDVARCKKFYEMVEARHREWYPDFPVPKASEGLKWFAQLRLEYPAELIDRVLDWYCVHVTADFVERALCGKTFYQKFVAIGKRMADCQRGRSGHSAIKEDIIN